MIRTFCDRCYRDISATDELERSRRVDVTHPRGAKFEHKQLCSECIDKLREWLGKRP